MDRIWYCQGNLTWKTNVETVSARTHKICGCTELILKGLICLSCEHARKRRFVAKKKTTLEQTLHFQTFRLAQKPTRI